MLEIPEIDCLGGIPSAGTQLTSSAYGTHPVLHASLGPADVLQDDNPDSDALYMLSTASGVGNLISWMDSAPATASSYRFWRCISS